MLPLPAGGAPHLFFLAAVAALIGGLSAIERKGAFQLMLSRPIVLAPILGGQWAMRRAACFWEFLSSSCSWAA